MKNQKGKSIDYIFATIFIVLILLLLSFYDLVGEFGGVLKDNATVICIMALPVIYFNVYKSMLSRVKNNDKKNINKDDEFKMQDDINNDFLEGKR